MLSRGDVASIRAEIERLEKALNVCTDGGIRERIKAWIEEENKEVDESCTNLPHLRQAMSSRGLCH